MPQIASAKKRVRVTERQTEENRLHRTRSRTALKKVRTLLSQGKTKEAGEAIAVAQSNLDKAAKVRAFHPNTVSRYKSRLAEAAKKAGLKGATPARQQKVATKAAPKKAAKSPVAKKATAAKKPAKKTT
jgi:small subunit ribosomal protein S20